MTKIIGVRFKPTGKTYFFDPLDHDIRRGMHVVVETSRGIEYGEVTIGTKEADENTLVKPLKGVIRIATQEDDEKFLSNKQKEKEAFKICKEKIRNHGLDMKLIEVEYTFDGNKILFYFTSDGRVDFRDLVKDLASVFRTRIELRQIGVRDESKTLGSIGMCGRNLCCSQFLSEFAPVSVKMAKEQGLSLNPTKISGVCGRLMCCLKYEQDTYEDLIRQSPQNGEKVRTPDGEGTVISVALMRGKVKVKLDGGDDMALKEFDVSELNMTGKAEPVQDDVQNDVQTGEQVDVNDTVQEEIKETVRTESEGGEETPRKKQRVHKRKPRGARPAEGADGEKRREPRAERSHERRQDRSQRPGRNNRKKPVVRVSKSEE